MAKALSAKERDFCRHYVTMRNAREAAMLSGFTVMPDRAGEKLLAKAAVREEISRLCSENEAACNEALAGFRRLAFGSVADAVKLVTGENVDIERLDLFMVSDIKIPKGGGIEIKFFDRQKALECLARLESNATQDSAMPFYRALEKSAAFISSYGDDADNEQ